MVYRATIGSGEKFLNSSPDHFPPMVYKLFHSFLLLFLLSVPGGTTDPSWNPDQYIQWNLTEIPVKFHWNPSEIPTKFFTEIPVKSHWNPSEISLKSQWNFTEIPVKFHWNPSEIPTKFFTEIPVGFHWDFSHIFTGATTTTFWLGWRL